MVRGPARSGQPANDRMRRRIRARRSGSGGVRRPAPRLAGYQRAHRSAARCMRSNSRHGHHDRSGRPAQLPARHRRGRWWRPRAGPTRQGSPPSTPRSVQKSAPAGQPGLWAENSSAAGALQNPSGPELTTMGVGSRDRRRARFLPADGNDRAWHLRHAVFESRRIPLPRHVFSGDFRNRRWRHPNHFANCSKFEQSLPKMMTSLERWSTNSGSGQPRGVSWWSKSREEPDAHKQRHPINQDQIEFLGQIGSTQFLEQGYEPCSFFV